MASSQATLRLTLAALMRVLGERQEDLAEGLRVSQAQVSRKQGGQSTWTIDDLDSLSAHYGIPVPDLLCGVDHAVQMVPPRRRAALIGGRQTMIPAHGE